MLFLDEDEAPTLDPERPLEFLHGLWLDEADGSTICIHVGSELRAIYRPGEDHERIGRYLFWERRRGQFYAYFGGHPGGRPAGVIVLQAESQDHLIGGWWSQQDVAKGKLEQLPFAPGVHPCRWVRQDPRRPWPGWAVQELGLPDDGSATSERLAPAKSASMERTAAGRYRQRLERWTAGRAGPARLTARLGHHAWWLLHNLVAHPLLALVPGPRAVVLHDWSSRRLNRDEGLARSGPPRLAGRLWWLVHNFVAHPAIGLVPCETTFRWHDTTARRMRVPGWA